MPLDHSGRKQKKTADNNSQGSSVKHKISEMGSNVRQESKFQDMSNTIIQGNKTSESYTGPHFASEDPNQARIESVQQLPSLPLPFQGNSPGKYASMVRLLLQKQIIRIGQD